jgi:hypothetical protein
MGVAELYGVPKAVSDRFCSAFQDSNEFDSKFVYFRPLVQYFRDESMAVREDQRISPTPHGVCGQACYLMRLSVYWATAMLVIIPALWCIKNGFGICWSLLH